MKVNLNDSVKVRLTPHGQEVISADYARYGLVWHPTADGWYTFQLWYLMNVFGPNLCARSKLPFERNEVYLEND